MDRDFEIIVYGATGFTGRLVAEHLLKICGATGDLKWAIAGRNPAKLDEVRSEIGAPANFPLVIADASDPASLTAMARRSKAIITTAGPYQVHGSGLMAACAAEGTDYLDITGESNWIHDMLVHEALARNSGARIVFCCGFDSIPSTSESISCNRRPVPGSDLRSPAYADGYGVWSAASAADSREDPWQLAWRPWQRCGQVHKSCLCLPIPLH
jgi:short subunit dehydrogenase-like uncharacterized protein